MTTLTNYAIVLQSEGSKYKNSTEKEMPRQARLDTPGTLHHIIIRGIEQRKIVDDRKDRENFLERLGRAASETRTSIYAWALMPNHAHFLLRSVLLCIKGG